MKFLVAIPLVLAAAMPSAPAQASDAGAAIIGGIIGYTLGRNATPYYGGQVYAPPPVYYPPPVPQAPPYSGVLPPAPYGYTYAPQYLYHCNCHQWILIPAR